MNLRTMIMGLILVALAAVPALADAPLASDALPILDKMLDGEATINVESKSLTIDQQSNRAVLRWNSFDIGKDAAVHFAQRDSGAAALNIVDSTTSSMLAGKLSADGSVFLINPHGITVTPDGNIDTGGAFIASTLGLEDDEHYSNFMGGSDRFSFTATKHGPSGKVQSAGVISAGDAALVGSRVENSGTITARLGRVALGSASHATLDLTGDGFLQVLAPADIDETDTDPLITNSGAIVADGGLVQLKASTVHEAMREAIHMPGEVRARGVSGRDGAIVFSGGDGGTVAVSGTVDASPDVDQGGTGGGSVRVEGTVVDIDFDDVHLGAGGNFSLAADAIEIIRQDGNGSTGATVITEGLNEGSIGDLLRAGVNVTLHGNESLVWRVGLMMSDDQLMPEAAGKAGDVHLLAGRELALGGHFRTLNGNWRLSVNAKPVSGIQLYDEPAYINMFTGSGDWARFVDANGHLTLEMLHGEESAGLKAGSIDLPEEFSGEALTAHIPSGITNYEDAYIRILGKVQAADAITLSGHLFLAPQQSGVTTLHGQRVTWTTEQADRLVGGHLLRFKEGGVVTRFGRGGTPGSDVPYVDATRLILGSKDPVSRVYGDPDPEVAALWGLIFHLAPHNKVLPGHGALVDGMELEGIPNSGISLADILMPGSIAVEGPGVKGEANKGHYLRLVATDQISFRPVEWEHREIEGGTVPWYLSGAAGGYWIDFSEANDLASRVPLIIEPRPLTVEMLNPSYAYGFPHEALLELVGVVNDDQVIPTGQLRIISHGGETDGTDLTYAAVGSGFGLDFRIGRGEYAYSVTGLAGERAGNYVLNLHGVADGTLRIAPRSLTYNVSGRTLTYGDSVELPSATLGGVLSGDDVGSVVGLFRGQQLVEHYDRLAAADYVVRVIALSGEDADNYELTGGTDGWLRVRPREVTWSVADATSVYGTLATFDVTLDGVLNGDDVGGSVRLRDVDAPLTERTAVGSYATVVDSLFGADSGNYTLVADWSAPGNNAGRLTIKPKQLSLDASPLSIVYGDISSSRFPGENPRLRLLGVLDGDEVLLKSGYVQRVKVGQSHGPDGADIGVGKYELHIVVDGDGNNPLEGSHSHNYVLSSELTAIPMTVTPRSVQVKAWNTDAVYGTRAFPGYDIEGALAGDQVHGRVTAWSGNDFIDYDERTPVGLYTLRVTELWGEAAANYAIDPAHAIDGFLQIAPKVLRFSSPVSIVYGDEPRFRATTAHGVLEGDSVQVDAWVQAADGKRLVRPGVGTYTGVATGISGADAGNYKLPEEAERMFEGLTISQRPITVHVSDQSRTYGSHPQTVAIRVDNVVPGDVPPAKLTFEVARADDGNFVPLMERTGVGQYRLRVRMAQLDNPNYTLAETGHTEGLLEITPKPIRYTTFDWQVEYGKVDPYLGQGALNESDIVSGDNVLPGTVVVAHREMYPERLQTNNKYPLALDNLTGPAKDNYVIEHAGSTQGLLTVLPKRIQHSGLVLDYNGAALDWRMRKFGDLETLHGFAEDEDGGFSINLGLSGVLPGDEVSALVVRPRLEYSRQGYLAAGEYIWTLEGLSGSDSHNYVLADGGVSRSLEIQPRPVRLYAEKTGLEYGQTVPNVDLRFEGDDDKFFVGAALDVTNIVFRGRDGHELTWDDLWQGSSVRLPAGEYSASILDESKPFLIGADAKNFTATLAGAIQISRRTLRFTPPLSTSWVYGQAFSERSLYDAVIDRDRAPGVLPGDEVGFEYWTVGRGISENNLNAILNPYTLYSPAGEYGGFEFRLTGADAANYELIQPDYTVTIEPRPLKLPLDRLYPGDDGSWEYVIDFTDVVRPNPGDAGGVMPEDEADEAMFVGVRGDDGIVRPIHAMDAGRYDMQSLALTGRWAGNYELVIRQPDAFLRINPRDVLFSIGDVDGHYGNFVACWDPRTCNGGPRGPHGDRYLWVPGLKLGDVELEGILPGHDVRVGDVILIDAAGRTGRLEDMPQPGVYFQVVAGLVGEDARNYRIASSGSRPGILTIFPQWVRWETTDGIYMPETGFRSLNPNPNYDTHPKGELLPGLHATLRGAEGDLDLDPEFQFVGLDIDLWEDTRIGNPRNLRPGNYSIEVSGFAGDAGALYQPVPGSMGFRGILSVFADSRLGLESVGSFDGELPPAGRDLAGRGGAPSSGTGPSVPAAGTGSRATTTTGAGSASGTNSSPGFGARVDPELFNTAGLRGDAYAGVLAEYGVTGVKLKADAGIEVEYQIGAGYVRAGSEARAHAEIGPTGVSGSTRVTATVGGGGGGSLGGGLDGRGEGRVGVIAGAEGKAGLIFENGNFKMGTKTHVGAGVSAGAEGSLSWHAGSVDAGVTVYSPGSIGQNFSFGAGMSGAVLTIDATVGLALGFGGVELDLGFSIDLGGLRDGFESFACGSGLVSCSPSQMELGQSHALAARDIADPLERFAYLHQNDQWRYIGGAIQDGQEVDPDIAQAYFENRAFFDYVEGLLTDVERYITEQEQAQAQFFRDLEEDPMSALNMARNTYSEHNYFTQQAQSIHGRMTAIGMRLELRRENLEGLDLD